MGYRYDNYPGNVGAFHKSTPIVYIYWQTFGPVYCKSKMLWIKVDFCSSF